MANGERDLYEATVKALASLDCFAGGHGGHGGGGAPIAPIRPVAVAAPSTVTTAAPISGASLRAKVQRVLRRRKRFVVGAPTVVRGKRTITFGQGAVGKLGGGAVLQDGHLGH